MTARKKSKPRVSCIWTHEIEDVYTTSCGKTWQFTDGTPAENDAIYCHHCGGRLQVVALRASRRK